MATPPAAQSPPPDDSTVEVSDNTTTRSQTPTTAVQSFDGGFQAVRAREVRTRACTRPLANFLVMTGVLVACLITAVVLLAVNGFNSTGADWLKTLIAFVLGVFVPNPHLPKKAENADANSI